MQTTFENIKRTYKEMEADWKEKKRTMDRMVSEAQNNPVNDEVLAPNRCDITNATENGIRANSRLDKIDTDKKLPKLIITGLPNRYQSIPGLCHLAANELGVEIEEIAIACT